MQEILVERFLYQVFGLETFDYDLSDMKLILKKGFREQNRRNHPDKFQSEAQIIKQTKITQLITAFWRLYFDTDEDESNFRHHGYEYKSEQLSDHLDNLNLLKTLKQLREEEEEKEAKKQEIRREEEEVEDVKEDIKEEVKEENKENEENRENQQQRRKQTPKRKRHYEKEEEEEETSTNKQIGTKKPRKVDSSKHQPVEIIQFDNRAREGDFRAKIKWSNGFGLWCPMNIVLEQFPKLLEEKLEKMKREEPLKFERTAEKIEKMAQ